MTVSSVTLAFFPLLMAFAASSDLLTMRISNVLVLVLAIAFFFVVFMVGMPPMDIVAHTGIAAAVLVAGFAFFAFGWIGGGDSKLAAATVLWIGPSGILPYLVYAALLGGALTLAVLTLRRWPLPLFAARIGWIDRLHDAKAGVPYGVALAAAGILVYSRTEIFAQLVA
jgi:prepilin peptidase CpaA